MKILVATEDSPDELIRLAARLVPLAGAEIHVVSVARPPVVLAGGPTLVDPQASEAILDTAIAETDTHLADAERAIAGMGAHATMHRRLGNPASEILEVARGLQPDLVVVGSHSKNAISRLVWGSVSDEVLAGWRGAVLVVPR